MSRDNSTVVDISGLTDGSLERGFALKTLCKPEDVEYRFEGQVESNPLVHIIFSGVNITELPEDTSRNFRSFIRYENSDNDTITDACEALDIAHFGFRQEDDEMGNGVILTIKCPNQKGRAERVGALTFGIRMRLRSDSIFCRINIKEILVQPKSVDWYGRDRDGGSDRKKRSALQSKSLAVAAAVGTVVGAGVTGSTLYAHYSKKGLQEQVAYLTDTIHVNQLKNAEFVSKMSDTKDTLKFQLETSKTAVNTLSQQLCVQTVQQDRLTLTIMAESMANSFQQRVMLLLWELEENVKGNAAQNTVIRLCRILNKEIVNNEELCTEYYQVKTRVQPVHVQAVRDGNNVRIGVKIRISKPKFHMTPSRMYNIMATPIPLKKLNANIYRYQELTNLPKRMVHLEAYDQMLMADEDCTGDKNWFCTTSLLNRIFDVKSSYMAAVINNLQLDACKPTVLTSISDCVITVQKDYVLLSASKKVTFLPHTSEQISIHHLNSQQQTFPAGTSILTAKNLTDSGFLMCDRNKVYVRQDRMTDEPVEVVLSDKNATDYTVMSEVDVWVSMTEVMSKNREELAAELSKLEDSESRRKKFIELMEHKVRDAYPIEFFEKNHKLLDNKIIPYATIGLLILLAATITLSIICCCKAAWKRCMDAVRCNRTCVICWKDDRPRNLEAIYTPALSAEI